MVRNNIITRSSTTGHEIPTNADEGEIFFKVNITWHWIYFKEFLLACIIQTSNVVKHIGFGVTPVWYQCCACTKLLSGLLGQECYLCVFTKSKYLIYVIQDQIFQSLHVNVYIPNPNNKQIKTENISCSCFLKNHQFLPQLGGFLVQITDIPISILYISQYGLYLPATLFL